MIKSMLKRSLDIVLSLILILFFLIPFLLIAIFVKLSSRGPIIHWSKRIGKNNKLFMMPKFRSMMTDVPQVATHLLTDSEKYITPIGEILRKTSLDELPQLWSVLVGDMSFVGPRPALFNQNDLIELRTQLGVEKLRPGITGWAQINGRDELSNLDKAKFDLEYKVRQSFLFDLKIILFTFFKVFKAEGIRH